MKNPKHVMLAFQYSDIKKDLWEWEIEKHEKNMHKICNKIFQAWDMPWCSINFDKFYQENNMSFDEIYDFWKLAAKRADEVIYYISYPHYSKWIIEYEYPEFSKRGIKQTLLIKDWLENLEWIQPLKESINKIIKFKSIDEIKL